RYIEPMVHWGRELLSEAGYFHSVSMMEDPRDILSICDKYGVRCSSLSGHTPLCKPDISVNYLRSAIRFAHELKAPIVNTDEGPKPDFTSEQTDHELMKYTLTLAARSAEARGIKIGLEQHQQYSKTPAGLDRIYGLVASEALGINFDTGNSYLAGEDPYDWLEHVRDRLVHVHAKDISIQQSEDERGKVTGTPVGCACGEGVIDWARVIEILKPLNRTICFSVECGTIEQAAASIDHLKSLI
ncbi:MAG: sugar phosphate isomerase/epimerase, partial [Planctomycetota bacterium]